MFYVSCFDLLAGPSSSRSACAAGPQARRRRGREPARLPAARFRAQSRVRKSDSHSTATHLPSTAACAASAQSHVFSCARRGKCSEQENLGPWRGGRKGDAQGACHPATMQAQVWLYCSSYPSSLNALPDDMRALPAGGASCDSKLREKP